MDAGGKNIKTIGAAILAGGLGTRMKSEAPKGLVSLLENPLIFYAVESLIGARRLLKSHAGTAGHSVSLDKIGIVIGHKGEDIKDYTLRERRFRVKGLSIDFAVQKKYLGTGDAVNTSLGMFSSYRGEQNILILPCDMPLIRPESFFELIISHLNNNSDLTVLSVEVENPYSYGRILRDKTGSAMEIVEEKELARYPEKVRKTNEINSGVYILKLKHLKRLIGEIRPLNREREYYFTDIVNIFYKNGLKTTCLKSPKREEFGGVNSRAELENAKKILQARVIKKFIDTGVDIMSPENIYAGYNIHVEAGATLYPGVFLTGKTHILKGARIETGCVIDDSTVSENAAIKSYSVIEKSAVSEGCRIGPFAHLRPGSFIGKNSKIGNFVEVKNSSIGEDTKASHLSYIGDATIGNGVNVGAGAITCNYDGINKHETVIEDGCFIGSDSQIVAPVTLKRGSYVASGTTVTRDVPGGALAISRTRQKNIENWAKKRLAHSKPGRGRGE